MALSPIAGVEFFFFLSYSRFFFLQLGLAGSLEQGGAGALSSVNIAFLDLDSSVRSSLAVVPWVCTFEKVLWDGQWPLQQWASDFRTMVLDFRPALASALTTFCTISSKSIGSRSCYSILTLMQDLRLSRK